MSCLAFAGLDASLGDSGKHDSAPLENTKPLFSPIGEAPSAGSSATGSGASMPPSSFTVSEPKRSTLSSEPTTQVTVVNFYPKYSGYFCPSADMRNIS